MGGAYQRFAQTFCMVVNQALVCEQSRDGVGG